MEDPVPECRNIAFISGWGLSSSVFDALKQELSGSFQFYNVALPVEKNADCSGLDSILEYFREQMPERCHIIAWSLGAMFAARLAERWPERVASLTSLCANAKFTATDTWPCAMEAETFARFKNDFLDDWQKTAQRFVGLQVLGLKKRRAVLASLKEYSYLRDENQGQAFEALQWLTELDNREYLKKITVPQCHIFGCEDALVPRGAAESIEELISANERNTIHILEEAGHLPHVACPDQLAPIINHFICDLEYELKDKVACELVRDRKLVAQSFSRAATSYDQHAALQKNVAGELVSALGGIAGAFLDLGCGTGFVAEELIARDANIIYAGLDFAPEMLSVASAKIQNRIPASWYCADMEQLPFEDNKFDAVSSSLAMQWLESPKKSFSEVKRVLNTGGMFALATLGPKTLSELRVAWTKADPEHIHVNEFLGLEHILSLTEKTGFELELCRVHHETIEYDSVMSLMRDLKGIGAHNVNLGRNSGMTGRGALHQLTKAYEAFRK